MIKPNIQRVLIRPIKLEGITTSEGIVLPGQQKAGENLLYGYIVDAGDSGRFEKNQEVFYSEYSAAAFVDAREMLQGKSTLRENPFLIVAEDDVMAYYEDVRSLEEIMGDVEAVARRRDELRTAWLRPKEGAANDAGEVPEVTK